MDLRKGQIIEVTISDLAFGGAGVGKFTAGDRELRRVSDEAHPTELVVFVEKTVPGDRIAAELTKIKSNFAEARLSKIIEPSAERITARCKHFGTCGGCTLQFLSYEDQLKWKEKMVMDALTRIGGFEKPPLLPICGAESPWFYRNKMEFTFSADFSGELHLGFHERKSFSRVFNLEECFLESPLSVEIVLAVQKWAKEKGLTAHNPRTNEGVLKNLVVREGKNTGDVMVNLITNGKNFPEEHAFAEYMSSTFPQITSLYRTAVTVRKGSRTTVDEFHLAGKKVITETLNVADASLHFEIHPQAFFQTNTKQAELLYAKVLEFAEPKAKDHVLDLFCGTGTIGMFFAKLGAHVTGIELNASAIENATTNATKNNLTNIEFLCGDVFDVLSSVDKGSLIITDPPRAGMAPKSLEKILNLNIPKWIYVSCNPTTLARDLKVAQESGYTLQRVQPVDMFPQTFHVETVALLTNS